MKECIVSPIEHLLLGWERHAAVKRDERRLLDDHDRGLVDT